MPGIIVLSARIVLLVIPMIGLLNVTSPMTILFSEKYTMK